MQIEGFDKMSDEQKHQVIDELTMALPEQLRADVPTSSAAASGRRLRALKYARLRANNVAEEAEHKAEIARAKPLEEIMSHTPKDGGLQKILGSL